MAGEAGYIGQTVIDTPGTPGVLPTIPQFIENDPYLDVSEVEEADLGLIEFFSEGDSISQQCTF